jgi:hypothetical protein
MTSYPQREKSEFISRLVTIIFMLFFLLLAGTLFFHFSEGWSYLDALYYSTMSVTSRGYTDHLYPKHWASVLFSVFYLLFGALIVLFTLSTFISYYTAFYKQYIENKIQRVMEKVGQPIRTDKWVFLRPKQP